MTLMGVQGHLRSNGLNFVLRPPNLVKRITVTDAENNDDLHQGQRSTEVKWCLLCATATKLGRMNHLWMLRTMMTFNKVKGQQRSKGVYIVL